MDLGLQLYGPIANWKGDLKELMKGIKAAGISLVEPCISLDGKSNNPSFWSMEKCREVFPFLAELGLKVISCHVGSEDLEASIPAMCELVDKFGVKQIIMGTPALDEETLKEMAKLYCKIADELAKHGAELLLHNGKPDIATKIQGMTAYEYMVTLCQGKVGMQFDTGWAARGGEEPLNVIKRNEDSIKSFHYKDFDMRIDTDVDTCIGDGTLDNESFLQFVQEKKIPQFIDADTYADVLRDLNKSYKYITSLCK